MEPFGGAGDVGEVIHAAPRVAAAIPMPPSPPDRLPPLPPLLSASPRTEAAAQAQSGRKEDHQPRPRVVISLSSTITNTARVRPPIPKSSLNIVENADASTNNNYSNNNIYSNIQNKLIKQAGGRSRRFIEREKDNPYLTIANATADQVRAQHIAIARRLGKAGGEGPLKDLEEYLKGVGENKRDRGFKTMMEDLSEAKASAARADTASERVCESLEGAMQERELEKQDIEDYFDDEPVIHPLHEAYALRQNLVGATADILSEKPDMENYFDDEPVIHPLHGDYDAGDESFSTERGRLAAYIHPAFRSGTVVLGKEELEIIARGKETAQYVSIPEDVRAKKTALYKKKYEEKQKLEAREGVKKRKLEEENERVRTMSLSEAADFDFSIPDPEIPDSVYDELRKQVTVIEDGAPNPNPRPLPIEPKDERAPWWTFRTEWTAPMILALHTMDEEYEDGHWQDTVNAADEAERAEKLLAYSAHNQKLMEELVLPTWKAWNLKKRAKAVVADRVRGARAALARRDDVNGGADPDLEDAASVAESYNPEIQDVGFEGDAVVIPAVAGAVVVWFMSNPENEGIDIVDILGEDFLAHAEMGPPPAAVYDLLKDEEASELFEKYKKKEIAKEKRNEGDDDMWEDISDEEEAGLPRSNTQMVLYTGNRTRNFHTVDNESSRPVIPDHITSDFESFAYSTFAESSPDGTVHVAKTTRQPALEEGFGLVDLFASPSSPTHLLKKAGTADATSVRLPSPGVDEDSKDETDPQGITHSATIPFSATILNLGSFAGVDTASVAGADNDQEEDVHLSVTEEAYIFNCFRPPTPEVDVEGWFERPHVSILDSKEKRKVDISLVPNKPILFPEDESEDKEDGNKVDAPTMYNKAEYVVDEGELKLIENTDWIRTADEYKHGLNGRPHFNTRIEEDRRVAVAQQPDNRIYMTKLRGFIERGYFSDILPKPLNFPESTPSELSQRDAAWTKHCLSQRVGLLLEDQLWNRMRVSIDGVVKQKWVKPRKRYPKTIAQGYPPPKNYVRKEDTQAALVMAVWQTLREQQLKKELDSSYIRGPQRMIKGAPVPKEKGRAASTSKSLLFKAFPAYMTDDPYDTLPSGPGKTQMSAQIEMEEDNDIDDEVDAHDMSGDVTAVLEEVEQDKQEEPHILQLDLAKMTDEKLKSFSASAASVLSKKFPELVDDWNANEERHSLVQRFSKIENKRVSGLKPKRGVSGFGRPTPGVSSFSGDSSTAVVPSQIDARAGSSFSGHPYIATVPYQAGVQGVTSSPNEPSTAFVPSQPSRHPSSPPIMFPALGDDFKEGERQGIVQREASTLSKHDSEHPRLIANDFVFEEKLETPESLASEISSDALARKLRERMEKATANIEKRLANALTAESNAAVPNHGPGLLGAEAEPLAETRGDEASSSGTSSASHSSPSSGEVSTEIMRAAIEAVLAVIPMTPARARALIACFLNEANETDPELFFGEEFLAYAEEEQDADEVAVSNEEAEWFFTEITKCARHFAEDGRAMAAEEAEAEDVFDEIPMTPARARAMIDWAAHKVPGVNLENLFGGAFLDYAREDMDATPVIVGREDAVRFLNELLDDIGAEAEADEEELQNAASNRSMTAAQAFALIDWYLQRNNTEDIAIVEFLGAEFLAFAMGGEAADPVEVTAEEAEEFFAHYGSTWEEQVEGAEVPEAFEVLAATSHESPSESPQESEADAESASGPEKAAESGAMSKDGSGVISRPLTPSQVRDFVAYVEKNGKPFNESSQIKAYMELPDDAPPGEFKLTRRENGLYNQMLIEKRVAYEKRKQAYEKGELGYGFGLTGRTEPNVKRKRKVLSMLAEGSVSSDSTLEEQGHVGSVNQEGENGKPFAQEPLAEDYFGHWEDVSSDLGGLGIVLPKRGKRTATCNGNPEKDESSNGAFGLGLALPDGSKSISPNTQKSRQRNVFANGPARDRTTAAKIAHGRPTLSNDNFSSSITSRLDSPISQIIQRRANPRSKKPVREGRFEAATFDEDSDSDSESSAIAASNVARILFRAKANDGEESRPKDDRRRSASFFRPLLGQRKLTLRSPFQSPAISSGWDAVSDIDFPLVEDGGTPVPASTLEGLLAKGENNLTEEDLEVLGVLVRNERLTRILAAIDQAVERSYQIALENEAKEKRKEKRRQAKLEAERKAEVRKQLDEERREDILEAEHEAEKGNPDALAKVLDQHAEEDARSAQKPPADPSALLEEQARRHAQAHHDHLYALDPKATFKDALMIAIKAECLELAEIEYLFKLNAEREADTEKGNEKRTDQFYHVQEHQERMQLLAEQSEWEGALARVELWRQAHAEYVDPNYFIPEEVSVPEGGDWEVEELDNEAKDDSSSEASHDTGIVYERVEVLELTDWITAFKENQLKQWLRSRRTTEATHDSPKLSNSNNVSREKETNQGGITAPERRKSLKIVKRAISMRRSAESVPKVFAEPSAGQACPVIDGGSEEPSEVEKSMHAAHGSAYFSGDRGKRAFEVDSINSPGLPLERRRSKRLVKRRTMVPSDAVAPESLSKPSIERRSVSGDNRLVKASVLAEPVPARQFSAGSFSLRRMSVITEHEGYQPLSRTPTAKSEVSLALSNETAKIKSKKKWNLSLSRKSKDKRSSSLPLSPADAAPPKGPSELKRVGSLFERKEQQKKDLGVEGS